MNYETKDVNVKKIAGYTLAVVILLTAIMIFLNEYFVFEVEEIKQERNNVPSSELRDLNAREEEMLNSYKVLNADKNQYQIPMDRAMKLLADEAYEKQKNKTK